MKISRRDTAIIAVLVNVALLAVLFATASKWEKDALEIPENSIATVEQDASQSVVTTQTNSPPVPLTLYSQTEEKNPVDEIDQVLQEYALKQKVIEAPAIFEKTSDAKRSDVKTSEAMTTTLIVDDEAKEYVTVTVKKGDALAKIAKAHGVKVDELMELNALNSIKLRIGQQLKIPKKQPSLPVCISKETKKLKELSKEPIQKLKKGSKSEQKSDTAEYYVIKSGDSPWKVARKFHLKYEDLLILNELDEEKARNLKIGQKIRIR